MKLFEMPAIEVLKFGIQDVIATSESLSPDPTETPIPTNESDFCI